VISRERIAVLGGGNGAHAMAADLALKGYEVTLCEHPEYQEKFSRTLERQVIDLIDEWGERRTVKIAVATTDFQRAVKGAGYVMMCVPAVGSDVFFESIMPHLEEGQTLVKWSANFSALSFANRMNKEGINKEITLAEVHTLPWGCRMVEPGTVQIMVWVVRMLLATFPGKKIDTVLRDIGKMYPVQAAENVLATSMNNLNPIVHPVGTVMNAGWIDTVGKDFHFYRDGNTVSISRGIKAVYEEYVRIARAVGISMVDYPEEDFWRKSAIMSTFSRAAFDKEGATAKISGPSSMRDRYITEDVPYGLVPAASLAKKFNVATPVVDAIIELASIINKTNYREKGMKLEEIGLASLGVEQIQTYLHDGL
jgi:opine dehydrogenase